MVLPPEVLSRAVVFVVALLVLLVAHQVGDHVLQTDRQALGKATRWRALAGHLASYHLTAAALLVGTDALLRLPISGRGLAAGLAFSVITHAVLDRRWPVRAILRATGSPQFAEATTPVNGLYVADQALHQLALLVSALLIATL
ncbi:MAG: DUF3307 domain-containing protein [Micromonosporaceae bacterium]